MSGLQKILVVDSGDRTPESALSVELAEMGYASITAPLEATEEVLSLIPHPAAVVLQMPLKASWAVRSKFMELADRLKASMQATNVPIIMIGGMDGGSSNMLQSQLGARIAAQPQL